MTPAVPECNKSVAVVNETEAVPDAVVGLAGNADSVGAIGMTVV